MAARGPITWFNDRAARPPSRVAQAFSVLLAPLVIAAVWDRRGVLVGVVALVVYGFLFVVAPFRHSATVAWSKAHPILSSLLLVPLAFLALAYVTDLSSAVCAAAGVGGWLLLLPLFMRRSEPAA